MTGIVCPCHVLAGVAVGLAALMGIVLLTLNPSEQDGAHTLYLPLAVLAGARLLTSR